MQLTPAERKLLASENDRGVVFYAPAQSRMVSRLCARGLLIRDTDAKPQHDVLRGAWVRPAIVQTKAHDLVRKHPR